MKRKQGRLVVPRVKVSYFNDANNTTTTNTTTISINTTADATETDAVAAAVNVTATTATTIQIAQEYEIKVPSTYAALIPLLHLPHLLPQEYKAPLSQILLLYIE